MKVKTFTQTLAAFHTAHEIAELDRQVNNFIAGGGVGRVISVSDTTTTGEGNTIGLIRVLAYEEV